MLTHASLPALDERDDAQLSQALWFFKIDKAKLGRTEATWLTGMARQLIKAGVLKADEYDVSWEK